MAEKHSLDRFFDQQVSDALRPVSLGIAVLYLCLGISHAVVLPTGLRETMTLCAALSSAVAFTFAWRLKRSPVRPGQGHAAMTLLTAIPLFNSALHLHMAAEPKQTTNLLMVQICVGIMFLERRWFAVATSTLLVTWLGISVLAPTNPDWAHYGFALLSASLISFVLHIAHRRQLNKLALMNYRDIEQQEQLEELAQTAVATSRSKSRFIAHLSHELRTPLSAIIGFSKLLQKDRNNNLDEKQVRYLASISSSGHHLLEVINQVLDLSSLEANRIDLNLSTVELAELATKTLHELHPLAKEKELELHLEGPAHLQALETDVNRLKQVLINLLGNAIKFTRQGAITLRLKGERHTLRPLALVVQDTGPGIAEDRLQSIFEPFEQIQQDAAPQETGRPPGSGLGLAISRLLCRRLGFELKVESTVGVGTKFTVQLVDPTTAQAPIRFDPNVTGTLALILTPDTDSDGIQIQSGPPKEDP